MAEVLSKIRTSKSGSELLRKSEMCLRRAKTRDAVGRASWRSAFLGPRSAGFFAENFRRAKNFLGRGRRRPLPKMPRLPGETGRKLKLLQVCPKNLSH